MKSTQRIAIYMHVDTVHPWLSEPLWSEGCTDK